MTDLDIAEPKGGPIEKLLALPLGLDFYKDLLTDTEIWQVSLLLANADKPLPPAAVKILHGEPAAPASAAPEAKKK